MLMGCDPPDFNRIFPELRKLIPEKLPTSLVSLMTLPEALTQFMLHATLEKRLIARIEAVKGFNFVIVFSCFIYMVIITDIIH
jgi:hypothetical protein